MTPVAFFDAGFDVGTGGGGGTAAVRTRPAVGRLVEGRPTGEPKAGRGEGDVQQARSEEGGTDRSTVMGEGLGRGEGLPARGRGQPSRWRNRGLTVQARSIPSSVHGPVNA